ncbi:cardiolipin synthase ClsB [Simplicispira psychrophila]|uniref:cardiolipin synthase ClsB n=1 Tax=Simplicispira psychrophila TaxID=80882 RepID=UPI00048A2C87|nr:cardiolipin synthase ClsB [Simplicispira psychrophila]
MKKGLNLGDGHCVQLLQGTVELFPALIRAIDEARVAIQLETYIFDLTGAGADVAEALVHAAQRGVHTCVLVDGFGTAPLPPAWAERFQTAGVQYRVYSPLGPLGLLLPQRWQRLHRKLCVVDRQVLFCGGINVLDDFYDPNYGALEAPRFDFAVQASGRLASQASDAMEKVWRRIQAVSEIRHHHLSSALRSLRAASVASAAQRAGRKAASGMRAALVLRDNLRDRTRIEKSYLRAVGLAREEIIIANAYFVPGRKLRRALVLAAQRGVRVRLLLQGRYEYFMQYHAARPVYGALLAAGVEIHEYAPSFLHAKVAVMDAQTSRPWATVGSSNLDPLSLLLAREANVVIEDAGFAQDLRQRLVQAMDRAGRLLDPASYALRPWRQRALDWAAFGIMRTALWVAGKSY